MARTVRIIAVTAGLVAVGAVLGAVAGAVALTGSLWITRDRWWAMGPVVGAFLGVIPGAVIAPLLGWSLLRRVPLGRMFTGCTAGAVLGGIVGWITTRPPVDEALAGLAGAVVGCVVAAINLRHRALTPARLRRALHD